MTNEELDIQFQEAFDKASNMTQPLPPDVMLRLYAYYKQATFGNLSLKQSSSNHIRDAFKTNAWMQISHLTADEAKECYIEIIHSLVKK